MAARCPQAAFPRGIGRFSHRAKQISTAPAITARKVAKARWGASGKPNVMSGKQIAHRNMTNTILRLSMDYSFSGAGVSLWDPVDTGLNITSWTTT